MAHRVFVSYVRENAEVVSRLVSDLRDHGIEVWFDRDALPPGVFWRDEIRDAVRTHEYFIACFSREYAMKSRTRMNEELQLAIEEIRLRGAAPWFIPVLLSGEVPDLPIGPGRTLRDVQHVDLAGGWDAALSALVKTLHGARSVSASGAYDRQQSLRVISTGSRTTEPRRSLTAQILPTSYYSDEIHVEVVLRNDGNTTETILWAHLIVAANDELEGNLFGAALLNETVILAPGEVLHIKRSYPLSADLLRRSIPSLPKAQTKLPIALSFRTFDPDGRAIDNQTIAGHLILDGDRVTEADSSYARANLLHDSVIEAAQNRRGRRG